MTNFNLGSNKHMGGLVVILKTATECLITLEGVQQEGLSAAQRSKNIILEPVNLELQGRNW
jgi:hypothetical protein